MYCSLPNAGSGHQVVAMTHAAGGGGHGGGLSVGRVASREGVLAAKYGHEELANGFWHNRRGSRAQKELGEGVQHRLVGRRAEDVEKKKAQKSNAYSTVLN